MTEARLKRLAKGAPWWLKKIRSTAPSEFVTSLFDPPPGSLAINRSCLEPLLVLRSGGAVERMFGDFLYSPMWSCPPWPRCPLAKCGGFSA